MKTLTLTLVVLCVSANAAAEEKYATPPEAVERADVPKGRVDGPHEFRSQIFPGTVRQYWVYVPANYDPQAPPCLMVVQDGWNKAKGWKLTTVLDDLIHDEKIPSQLGVFVSPGVVPAPDDRSQPRFNRSFEYDSLGDRYARFLLEELLPEVAQSYAFSDDPNDRCIAGSSSGAICAFTVAWERPDQFRRVYSTVGTYVGLRGGNEYPILVRKSEPRPLRIFLQDGSQDLDIYGGSWWHANQSMLSALQFSGYDVAHVWGEGGHNNKHGAAILPQALKWLWRDYPQPIRNVPGKPRRTDLLTPGQFWQPVDTAADVVSCTSAADGTVWFSDHGGRRVCRRSLTGEVTPVAECQSVITAMAATPSGDLLACAPRQSALIRIGTDGSVSEFARSDLLTSEATDDAHSMVVLADGAGFVTGQQQGQLLRFTADGNLTVVDDKLPQPAAVGVSADQSLLTVAADRGRFCYSWQLAANGGVQHRQEYGWLHVTDQLQVGVRGTAVDAQGRTYLGTAAGIQVLDQLGRVHFIIRPPAGTMTDLTFGGRDRHELYAVANGRLFVRPLKTTGVCPAAAPVKPPRPRL